MTFVFLILYLFGIYVISVALYWTVVVIIRLPVIVDFLYNRKNIDKQLEHSDKLDISFYEQRYEEDKAIQVKFIRSRLTLFQKEIKEIRLRQKKSEYQDEHLIAARNISNIFNI
jgi:hypothetical protein